MGKKKSSKIFSFSEWEDSEFGGYKNMLYDHPDIDVSYKIKFKMPKDTDLGWYTYNKLMGLFILKAKEFNQVDYLLQGATVVKGKNYGFYSDPDHLALTRGSIGYVYHKICNAEKELFSLFDYFGSTILDSGITVDLPKKENGNSGKGQGSGSDESQGNNQNNKDDRSGSGKRSELGQDGQGRGQPQDDFYDPKEVTATAKDLIGNTKERKSWSAQWGNAVTNEELKANTTFEQMRPLTLATQYTASETLLADAIAKRLDISFDMTQDKIKGLRSGKVETDKLCEFISGNPNIYSRVEEDQITKPFSVCILCDESGSMDGPRMASQYHLVKSLYLCLSDILPQDKIFIYGHTGYTTPIIRVYQDKYNVGFEYKIDRMLENSNEYTYDGPVIENVYEKIRSYTDENVIFLVITDGNPGGCDYGGQTAINELKKITEKMRRDQFVTVGVGVSAGYVKEIYQYYTVIKSLNEIPVKLTTVLERVIRTEFQ